MPSVLAPRVAPPLLCQFAEIEGGPAVCILAPGHSTGHWDGADTWWALDYRVAPRPRGYVPPPKPPTSSRWGWR